jgi:hypothetical protein
MNGNAQACVPCEPIQQLNDIASSIIDTLSRINSKVNVIDDVLFGGAESKTGQNMAEPVSLESKLKFIRGMSQDIDIRLDMIQSRT